MSFRVSGFLFLHLRLMRSCEISHENHLRELESYYRLNLTYGASERETAKQNLDHVSTKCAKMGGIISFYKCPKVGGFKLIFFVKDDRIPTQRRGASGESIQRATLLPVYVIQVWPDMEGSVEVHIHGRHVPWFTTIPASAFLLMI